MWDFLKNFESYFWTIIIVAVVALLTGLAHYIAFRIFGRILSRKMKDRAEIILKHSRRSSRWPVIFLAIWLTLPLLNIPPDSLAAVKHILSILLIGSISWLLIRLTDTFEEWLLHQYRIDVRDNLASRKIHTQIRVLKRIVIVLVAILAFATILMTFEKIQQLGTSLLASAGIIGIIVGMAAQRTIATFIAGIQIAVTQPIRMDDVVIVENEWGRIEEITLTYVVVRIWDQRRLIVPITYFMEKTFQNWTRTTADLLGTVYMYVDYTVPVEDIRSKLHELLKQSPHWDGKAWCLQVTNTTEKVMELRALMSASDAPSAWNMRCEIREQLLDYIQKKYPYSLPKLRTEIHRAPSAGLAPA